MEVDVQHSGASLAQAELLALLASPGLHVEANYKPLRLVEGVTATRQRIMPFGSQLVPRTQEVRLQGADVERDGRQLRFRLPRVDKEGIAHQLDSVWLVLPLAKGLGRPQPLRIRLLDAVAQKGAHQRPVYWPEGSIELGLRLRYRWSDAQGPWQREAPGRCASPAPAQDEDHYRFPSQPPHAAYMNDLRGRMSSDTTLLDRPPPGLEGWTLTRSQLGRYAPPGPPLEMVSLHAEQAGAGRCERAQSYTLVFWEGRLVEYEHTPGLRACEGEKQSPSVRARWDPQGRLIAHSISTPGEPAREWRQPEAGACPVWGQVEEPPAADTVEALVLRARELRQAFAPR